MVCDEVLCVLISQEKRTTKTIARCFAPDYSHFFDLALPLLQVQDDRLYQAKGHEHTASKSKCEISLAEGLARGSLALEIWHQVPRKVAQSGPTEARVFGRQLGPAFRDILLGYVEIPLVQLLQKHTGTVSSLVLHRLHCDITVMYDTEPVCWERLCGWLSIAESCYLYSMHI